MVESTTLEDLDTGKAERYCRYFKGKVLENHKVQGTDDTFENVIHDE